MTLRYILAAAALTAGAAAFAQTHPTQPADGEVTVLFEDDADKGDIYNIFVENAPKTHKIPGAPRFAIVGKDRKFYLGIGGVVKGTVSYDFGDPIDCPFDFTTSAIPMSPAKGNSGLYQATAATSGLYFNFVALPGTDNQVGAFINFNFTGNNSYAFDLQYAYLTYRGITLGYNYSLFSDMAAAPPTVDNEGAPGFTAIPNGVLDYEHTLGHGFKAGIGLEMPIASATTSAGTAMVNQRCPDVPMYVQYSWGKGGGSWLRVSAMLRNLMYRDVVSDRNRDVFGWGIKLSGSAALGSSPFTAYYQAAYGEGITSYFQDLYEGGLDLVPSAKEPGRLSKFKSWGGYLGLQCNFSPTVYSTLVYSHVRTYANDYKGGSTPWDSQYKYAQYAVANVFWNIKSYLTWGLEYDYGRRMDYSGVSHHDNRIQTMLQLAF